MNAYISNPSLVSGRSVPRFTCSFPFDNYKRNDENRDNFILPTLSSHIIGDSLFKVLNKISCPPTRFMQIWRPRTICRFLFLCFKYTQWYEEMLCALFGIFWICAFGCSTENISVYLNIRTDGRLSSFLRLNAKAKVHDLLIRDTLFTDDAAPTKLSEVQVQRFMDNLSKVCQEFSLSICLKKPTWRAKNLNSLPTSRSITLTWSRFTYSHTSAP